MSVDVQLFAPTSCETSMHRLSFFDSVPDFAAANCKCSFRNGFHFLNTTEGIPTAQNIIKVRDTLVHYTNREKVEMLSYLGVLETLPHPCNKSYKHTDYTQTTTSATHQRTSPLDQPLLQQRICQ
jgi:hypothetical protein